MGMDEAGQGLAHPAAGTCYDELEHPWLSSRFGLSAVLISAPAGYG